MSEEELSERMRNWNVMEFYNVRKVVDKWADEVAQLEAYWEECQDEYHKLNVGRVELEAEVERLRLAEGTVNRIGELSILMSTHDWFYRHTRRVLDEYHAALEAGKNEPTRS